MNYVIVEVVVKEYPERKKIRSHRKEKQLGRTSKDETAVNISRQKFNTDKATMKINSKNQ